MMLHPDQIRAGRFQPRSVIDEESLEELKASIKKSGVIEPVIVRQVGSGVYELVAGERRLRASQAIGIQEVPAIVKNLSDQETLELSLIENIQRENLNPWEEARGYARLLEEFGYTQEDIASAVGKDRATVANLLRTLTLPEDIQEALQHGAISLGHAKALLSVDERVRQQALFQKVKREELSVRQTELLASAWIPEKRKRPKRVDPQIGGLENELRRALGTKVEVVPRKKGGRIVIEYYSTEDFTRILQVLGITA